MLKKEIDCLIVHVGTLYTQKFYERALILEAYESTLLVKNKLEKKKSGPSVVFCKIGFITITPLKRIANQTSKSLFVYYRLIVQNSFCQTFAIRDLGQPLHPDRQVTFTCHLPRDKFCKNYLSDPDGCPIPKK